jgi:hypothetical protein
MITGATAVAGRLIDEEAGLAPDVQVTNDVDLIAVLDVGLFRAAAALAGKGVVHGPIHFKGVALLDAFIATQVQSFGHIQVNLDHGHEKPP